MNHEPVNEELLRRLEGATLRIGDERPELPDVESRRLHEGWQIVSRMLNRVVAEHDSVLIEERVRAGVERRIIQRRWRRRAGFVAVAASLLVGLMLGAWYNRQRVPADRVAGIEPGQPAVEATSQNTLPNEWPVGTLFDADGNPVFARADRDQDAWFDGFDFEIAMAREELWDLQRRWSDEGALWPDDGIEGLRVNPDEELENDSA